MKTRYTIPLNFIFVLGAHLLRDTKWEWLAWLGWTALMADILFGFRRTRKYHKLRMQVLEREHQRLLARVKLDLELCGTCNHVRRGHVHKDHSKCEWATCSCNTFSASGQYSIPVSQP